jgi:hypothetical protein
MTGRNAGVSRNTDESWTDRRDELTSLALANDLVDLSLEELAGALATKTEDRLSLPLIFEYSASTRRTSYRRGEAVIDLSSGRAPADSAWLEIDPRMSLRRAIDLYGADLLAFEKVVQRISLEIIVPVRQRHQQSLRVLVRRRAATSWTGGEHRSGSPAKASGLRARMLVS